MAYEQIKMRDIVDRAVNHNWSIPEFQRGFVWKATQVRDLAESLWYDYPIGSLLVWNSRGLTEEQHAHDAQRPGLWVVDGQQRSTDFLRDYGDSRFGRFFLYLLVYRNKAQDWDEQGHRIGFEGVSVLADFRPEWHHVFPKKYLSGKVDESLIDALANIAVIGSEINIRISAKDPMSYIALVPSADTNG
jgi:Protein of unknown function DUF262